MANDLIMRVDESVFGPGWETDMALALDVSERRCGAGPKAMSRPSPASMPSSPSFVAERQEELEGLAAELRQRGG